MEPDAPEIKPAGPQPEHHHPVPLSLVRLYGLLAVLFVLVPEWMADWRQGPRDRRIRARGAGDRESLLLRRQEIQRRNSRRAWAGLARGALLVGLGAGLVWGAGQLNLPLRSAAPTAPGQSPAATVPAGQLRLRAQGPSWVEVRTLEGRSLYGAILKGRLELPVGAGLKVLAGRPDLVWISQGNQPERALGRIDRVIWVEIAPLPADAAP